MRSILRPTHTVTGRRFFGSLPLILLAIVFAGLCLIPHESFAEAKEGEAPEWWNKEWTARKPIDIKAADAGKPDGSGVILVRLHEGNFPFSLVKEDSSDVRIIADDQKTELPFHFERYDALMNEAFLWLRLPEFAEGTEASRLWIYFGNAAAEPSGSAKETYGEGASLVYHFAERGSPARDYSGNDNTSVTSPTPTEGALIGAGILLFGSNNIEIPSSESLNWNAGTSATLMTWVKPSSSPEKAVIYRREEGENSFTFGLSSGVPFVEVKDSSGTLQTPAGEPVSEGAWRHLAVVAQEGKINLFVDGQQYASLSKELPALTGPAFLGGDAETGGGFAGELDEFEIHSAPLNPALIRFIAASQSGSPESLELIAVGADEGGEGGGHNETLEHVALFGDIAKNMMFDGWIAVGICMIMVAGCWWVAIQKFVYLNSIQKGSAAFLQLWKKLSRDLTALDHADEESVKTMGGTMSKKMMRHIRRSPLYHIYHIGCEEIQQRIGQNGETSKGLSGRSIAAIKSSLDAGLARENQNMNSKLVFLTISIAGGPYVGLLGTVVGVMITFAIISKSGEVEVNSIAPGIASALLATVAGLIVAIPALFIYSYLSSRIKDALTSMHVFIDEFIAKMAEFYPEVEEATDRSSNPAPAATAAHLNAQTQAPANAQPATPAPAIS
jgi:biopolymer transport protein ExbB